MVDAEIVKFRNCLDAFQSDHCKITWCGDHSERHMVCTLSEGDKARVVRVKDCEFEHTRK